jgi:NitT/TauT family transport system permease protein
MTTTVTETYVPPAAVPPALTEAATPPSPAAKAPPPPRRLRSQWPYKLGLPLLVAAVCLVLWDVAVRMSGTRLFPKPGDVLGGLVELARTGRLLKFTVSSLFRVTWGFGLAIVVGVPFGLLLGWFTRLFEAFNPMIQVLRPISPIAWIPVAILWFGVTDVAPVFLIFLASVFPITVSATAAVRNIQPVYVRAARNFGLGRLQLFARVIVPATLPQIITGIRIALGVAWLVVVAAEMVATDPDVGGLGYLIIDARNAGARYDLIVAGMVMIGLIGLGLDLLIRQFETFDEVRWGYANR